MGWRHFSRSEFDCKHCGENLMHDSFIDLMDQLREEYGKPVLISSGYRCPAHNMVVSSTGSDGPHTTGKASDIRVSRKDAYKLAKLAFMIGFTGIGFQQKGAGRFIHLDTLRDAPGQPRPTIWSYP